MSSWTRRRHARRGRREGFSAELADTAPQSLAPAPPRPGLPVAGALAALALAAASCGGGGGDAGGRPSVVLLVTDTLRADALGCYGAPGDPTPALDALAAEGRLFEQAYAPSSWTRASMASLLSGTDPRVHGVQGREHALAGETVLLSEALKAAGYATCLVTSNPNIGRFFNFDQAFDEFVELYDRREAGQVKTKELVTTADVVVDRALEWIDRAPRPFLLVLLTIDPHSPYEPPRGFDRFGEPGESEADGKPPWINRKDLTPADRRRIRGLYEGEVAFDDAQLGRLVDGLDERGLLAGSVLAFTSDHGEEFWEHGDRGHGKTLFDEVLHVPLLLHAPGRVAPGRSADLVRTVDLAPTLLELAGVGGVLPGDHRSLLAPGGAPEVASALDLDGVRLLSLRTPGWRLVVDEESGARRLFRVEDGERDLAADEPERAAELGERLAAHLAATAALRRELFGDAATPTVEEGALPAEHLEELQKLGYVDGDAPEDEER